MAPRFTKQAHTKWFYDQELSKNRPYGIPYTKNGSPIENNFTAVARAHDIKALLKISGGKTVG